MHHMRMSSQGVRRWVPRLGVAWALLALGATAWRHTRAARPGWVSAGVVAGRTVWVDTLPLVRAGTLGAGGWNAHRARLGDPGAVATERTVDVRCGPAQGRPPDSAAVLIAAALCPR